MARYILIDQHSGFIWGDVEATDPVEACREADAELGGGDRSYTEHGPRSSARANLTGGYFVYEAPADFPEVDDGQDQATIDAVNHLPCVSFVETHPTGE